MSADVVVPRAVPLPERTMRVFGIVGGTSPKEIFDFFHPHVDYNFSIVCFDFILKTNSTRVTTVDGADTYVTFRTQEEAEQAQNAAFKQTLVFQNKPIRLMTPAPEFFWKKKGNTRPQPVLFTTMPNTYRILQVPINAKRDHIAMHWSHCRFPMKACRKHFGHWYIQFQSQMEPPVLTQWFENKSKTILTIPASPVISSSLISVYPEVTESPLQPPEVCCTLPTDAPQHLGTHCEDTDDKRASPHIHYLHLSFVLILLSVAGKKRPAQVPPSSVPDVKRGTVPNKKRVLTPELKMHPLESELWNSLQLLFRHHIQWITEATELLKKRSLLNEVVVTRNVASINIVGDLHGSWDCLEQAMVAGKEPSETNLWIFNGNFVGSGAFSIDVLNTLCQLLVEHPGCVFLNRGNNECARTSKECGFQELLNTVFGEEMGMTLWGDCVSLFKHLPLASVVSFPDSDPTTTRSWFVTHSGILHPSASLSAIKNAERHDCSDATDILKQLLWSRPSNENGIHSGAEGHHPDEAESKVWGPDISSEFVKVNEFSLIIRSHDSTDRGYSITHDGRVLTVFS
ncbi:Serine/threonine-protein phosphatase 5 [Pelomyxa schiedti]|nr:Serine/threonine-protein phosphatase 5 [Pelomyxa schiedti]